MIELTFNRVTHFSIVWAVVLAILTMVEWRNLDREPMSEQIFLPFIEREITLSTEGDLPGQNIQRNLQTKVHIAFNGPLFLAYFFGPILIFHALGLLFAWLRR